MAPLIILGGIFTPTEAGAVAAVYSFVVTYFVYRELKLNEISAMLLRSALVSAIVIIGTSNIYCVHLGGDCRPLAGNLRPAGMPDHS